MIPNDWLVKLPRMGVDAELGDMTFHCRTFAFVGTIGTTYLPNRLYCGHIAINGLHARRKVVLKLFPSKRGESVCEIVLADGLHLGMLVVGSGWDAEACGELVKILHLALLAGVCRNGASPNLLRQLIGIAEPACDASSSASFIFFWLWATFASSPASAEARL